MPAFDHTISKRSRGTVPGPATTRNVAQKATLPGRPEAGSAHAVSQVRESLNHAPRVGEIAQLSRALQQRSTASFGRPVVQRVTANIVSPDPASGEGATKTTVIDASPALDDFDPPTIASNTVATPPRLSTTRAGTPAYIANVVTTARGKDKTVAQISAQYAAEAFDTPDDAAHRFALVALANREEKPTESHAEQANDLAARSTEQAPKVTAFPAAAGRTFWRRKWSAGPDRDHLTARSVDEIRAILAGASNKEEAAKAANDAAGTAGLPPGVPNMARNKAREMPQTAAWTTGFTKLGYTPYVHVGDADAVTMKATAAPEGSGAEQSLFKRYDELIARAPKADVLSGGYRFAPRPPADQNPPPHAAGADDKGKGLMAETRQAIKVSELDMLVRAAMQSVSPGMPYFPEPNIVVRADLYTRPGVGFGSAGTEWLKLKNTLLAERQVILGKQEFVRLRGTEITQTLCKFPIAARRTMEALFGAKAVQDWVPAKSQSGRGGRTPQPAVTEIKVSRGRQTIELALGERLLQASMPLVFHRSAALVTDVGRFDKPYADTSGSGADKAGADYTAGGTDPLALFDPSRAHQSHAQWGAIKSSLEYAYGITSATNQDWLKSAMRIFLPQQLFSELSETRATEGTLEERTTAATKMLKRVQGQLGAFSAFTAAISAEIVNPSKLNAAAARRKGRARDLTFQHKVDAVADRLTDHRVPREFINLLDDKARIAIWDAATSNTKPRVMGEITRALKAIGDAIASFLATY